MSTTADDRTQRLQEILQQLAAQKNVPHALIGVEKIDRSFRWIGTLGNANPDGTPMRQQTPYFIASVTKLYIATLVLRLFEQGHLQLETPMAAYLPEALIRGLHRLHGTDYTSRITLRHLLSHTSGLPDYIEERPKNGSPLIDRLISDGDRSWGIEEVVEIARDQLTPHFPPQSLEARRPKIRYSDTNYRLLIAIIEAITGQSLHAALTEVLFRPLNLRHTYQAGSAALDPAATPATLWFADRPLQIPLALQASGDLYSTASDTLAFMRALISGDVFDQPETLALMQQRWNRFGLPLDRAALRSPSWPIEYGFGIMRFRLPRLFTPLRAMPAVLGHTGSTGTWLFHCPALQLLLTGTVDQATAGAVPFRLVPQLLRLFLEP